MLSTGRNEASYQLIKLVKSGRTLREAKAELRAVAMGLHPKYANKKDVNDLASLEGGLHRLTMTRAQAKELAKVRFTPRKEFAQTKEEHLARWLTGYGGQGPIDWTRDGNLIRKGPPNKPRPGSAKGKIGKTRVRGAAQTLKNFRKLILTLRQLMASGKGGNVKQLQQAYKSVRTAVSIKGGKS